MHGRAEMEADGEQKAEVARAEVDSTGELATALMSQANGVHETTRSGERETKVVDVARPATVTVPVPVPTDSDSPHTNGVGIKSEGDPVPSTVDDLFKDEPEDVKPTKAEMASPFTSAGAASPTKIDVKEEKGEARDSDGESDSDSESDSSAGDVKRKRIITIKIKRQIHLSEPSAKERALSVFEQLEGCHYQSSGIGEPEQEEIMTCDCRPRIGQDGVNRACGPDSDCINRVTSIECVDSECSCGDACQNQRFQRRSYADVDVFDAGPKGFGLRIMTAIARPHTFVYEYLGEVINERKFRQRQVEYQEEGERHFYFMMLQRGEYIDATRRGGLGRFINHSCNPNCYVDKWVVGNKLRMGIFTKRDIARGEELTFDYNVDRYGGDATPCYCGEPTCLGYIGGKTQTEAANKLPQNIIEALGIDDEVDGVSGATTKKHRKKRRDEDDEEYVADLQPRSIEDKDVPKIMHTLMQSSERWILVMLLRRILEQADDRIHSKLISLHGYQALGSKLDRWKDDEDLTVLILEVLHRWPRVTKNKISSSKIETYVGEVAKTENASQRVRVLANDLIETWGQLEMAYRIPRRVRPAKASGDGQGDAEDGSLTATPARGGYEMAASMSQASHESPGQGKDDTPSRPRGPASQRRPQAPSWRSSDKFGSRPPGQWRDRPSQAGGPPATPAPPTPEVKPAAPTMPIISENLQAIIDAAKKQQEEQAEQLRLAELKRAEEKAEEDRVEAERREDRARRHREHKEHKEKRRLQALAAASGTSGKDHAPPTESTSTPAPAAGSSRDARDERTLLANFAKVVPNAIAKYSERLGKDEVKRRAKEICKVLVAKEMRKPADQRDVAELGEAKRAKVKHFAKEFMHKVIRHHDAKRSRNGSTAGEGSEPNDDVLESNVDDSAVASPAQDTTPASAAQVANGSHATSSHATPSSKRTVADLQADDDATGAQSTAGDTATSAHDAAAGERPRPEKQQKLNEAPAGGDV